MVTFQWNANKVRFLLLLSLGFSSIHAVGGPAKTESFENEEQHISVSNNPSEEGLRTKPREVVSKKNGSLSDWDKSAKTIQDSDLLLHVGTHALTSSKGLGEFKELFSDIKESRKQLADCANKKDTVADGLGLFLDENINAPLFASFQTAKTVDLDEAKWVTSVSQVGRFVESMKKGATLSYENLFSKLKKLSTLIYGSYRFNEFKNKLDKSVVEKMEKVVEGIDTEKGFCQLTERKTVAEAKPGETTPPANPTQPGTPATPNKPSSIQDFLDKVMAGLQSEEKAKQDAARKKEEEQLKLDQARNAKAEELEKKLERQQQLLDERDKKKEDEKKKDDDLMAKAVELLTKQQQQQQQPKQQPSNERSTPAAPAVAAAPSDSGASRNPFPQEPQEPKERQASNSGFNPNMGLNNNNSNNDFRPPVPMQSRLDSDSSSRYRSSSDVLAAVRAQAALAETAQYNAQFNTLLQQQLLRNRGLGGTNLGQAGVLPQLQGLGAAGGSFLGARPGGLMGPGLAAGNPNFQGGSNFSFGNGAGSRVSTPFTGLGIR